MRTSVAAACAVGAAAVVLSFFMAGTRVNPPIVADRTIEANLDVPQHVSAIMKRACADCHSNETKWPWYSRLAPVSWLVSSDVENARRAMNFSDWSIGAGKKRTTAMGVLAAACEGTKSGRMPPAQYRWMHPRAQLSTGDVDTLCSWTTAQMRQMAARAANVRHDHSQLR